MNDRTALAAALSSRYEIDREIGRGGMATVYLARDVKHARLVALKVLDPDLGAALGADRFLSEIRVSANLQHPNLLPLFDSGEANGLLFYVMPFVAGESLRARLDRETQLPINDAVRIACEALSALDYAHRHGVVHRDVKPENILLHDGSALVADFGIALAVTVAGGQRVTQTGLSLGTPQYMSPEQAMGERQIDRRADIYAMGAVLYEMLIGEPPFSGATVQAIVAKMMTDRPTSPRTVRDTISPSVEGAVLRALAKLPADRFGSAKDFADALQDPAAAGAYDLKGVSPTSIRPSTSRLVVRARVVPWSVAIAAVIAAVIAGTRQPSPAGAERYDFTYLGVKPIGSAPTAYVGPTIALSADGARLAYVKRDSVSGNRIWVRDVDDLEPRVVSGTEGAESVTMSPDGNRVAFIQRSGLRVVPVAGSGSVTTLASEGAIRPSWSEDGLIYFGSLSPSGERIARIPASGGNVEILAPPGAILRDPSPLPGGKAILVTRVSAPNVIAVVSLADGKVHVLGVGHRPRYVAPGYILFMDGPNFGEPGRLVAAPFDAQRYEFTGPALPVVDQPTSNLDAISTYAVAGGKTLVYMSGTRRDKELAWLDRNGSARPVDSTFTGTLSSPALSPDGSLVALVRHGSIWVKQLDHGPAFNLSLGTGMSPAWTADGKNVSYVATDSGQARELVQKPADGSGRPTPIVAAHSYFSEAEWSRDGKWLVATSRFGSLRGFVFRRPGKDTVPIEIPADTRIDDKVRGAATAEEVCSSCATYAAEPAVSPDGRWLAFTSNQSGQYEVYVVPFPNSTTGRWLVSSGGGTEPVWSPRGDELLYLDAAYNLVSVKVTAKETFTFGRANVLFSAADYGRSENHRQYDISHDGKSFLMYRRSPGGPAPRVVMIRNWLEAARSRSGAK